MLAGFNDGFSWPWALKPAAWIVATQGMVMGNSEVYKDHIRWMEGGSMVCKERKIDILTMWG